MTYSVVLIDLDDTLLDFGAASRASLLSLMKNRVGRPISEDEAEEFERINKACWDELEKGIITREQLSRKRFEVFFGRLGVGFDPMEANNAFRAGLADSAVLIPGALELCRKLSGTVELYLVTNGFVETQQRRLEAAGLDGLFRRVFTSQGLGYTKPDPMFFKSCFDEIGHGKEGQAIILGDSLTSDISGGKNYGIATCWFNQKGLPPTADCDYVITDLGRFIPDVLEKGGFLRANALN